MNRLDLLKPVHELSQQYIEDESKSLIRQMERVRVDIVTQSMVRSLILALKDKNELVTELYEEIDRLKAVAK